MEHSENIIERIQEALEATKSIFAQYTPGQVKAHKKAGGDPVTSADIEVNEILLQSLLRKGEGWLSEESTEDFSRLEAKRVWVVDPLDGTKEFVSGIPEWCVSIGYVVEGTPVAGGIFNPQTGEMIVGGHGSNVRYNGELCSISTRTTLTDSLVLGSRSESIRGEWDIFKDAPFRIRPMGSIAYKLALVAAGKAEATWTIVPKNEWDVAGGVALILAAGGKAYEPNGLQRTFNNRNPLMTGLVAHSPMLSKEVREAVSKHSKAYA